MDAVSSSSTDEADRGVGRRGPGVAPPKGQHDPSSALTERRGQGAGALLRG